MIKNGNSKENGENTVKVLIRVRPLISIEYESRFIVSIGPDVSFGIASKNLLSYILTTIIKYKLNSTK